MTESTATIEGLNPTQLKVLEAIRNAPDNPPSVITLAALTGISRQRLYIFVLPKLKQLGLIPQHLYRPEKNKDGSPLQRRYLWFIREYIKANGVAPSDKETAVYFGVTVNRVEAQHKAMVKKGLLKKMNGFWPVS